MNPKVSIIIPVYNAEKTVRRAVESLVYGEEREIEVILVEDCSKDQSWKICQELEKEFTNVYCFRNEKNRGVSFSRNCGIKKAGAPYVMFLDSDDWASVKYISEMLFVAENFDDALPICCFHFWDLINYKKMDYVWSEEKERNYLKIKGKKLFDALDKNLLQVCWNKIFERELIEKEHIFFDESQCMGEDFGFVLDYMLATGTKQCVIINQPLYYYTREKQNSLMSRFGWQADDTPYYRLRLLGKICGENSECDNEYIDRKILELKENMIYHVIRTRKSGRKEKKEQIRRIVKSDLFHTYYRKGMQIYYFEKIVETLYKVKNLKNKIKGRLQEENKNFVIRKEKKRLLQREVSVISQNCIGGVFYHDMGMKFLTPTINLFFKEPDFVKFVLNLKYYLRLEIDIKWEEEYPIGKIDDIEIHFMHYDSCKEAKMAWERRKDRINFEKIVVVATDRDGFTEEVYEQWKQVPYDKVLFSANNKFISKCTVLYPEYITNGMVEDLITYRKFYRDNILVDTINKIF